jgi:hypothetical protein
MNAVSEVAVQNVFHEALVGDVPLGGYSVVNQGWQLFQAPGQPIVIINPRFGKLVIGMTQDGKYDQWLFEENNGGGVLSVGYYVDANDKLWVLMLNATRGNLIGDEQDIECTGGFHDGNTMALPESLRETIEEAGIVPNELVELAGRKFTFNRAFGFLKSEELGTDAFSFELSRNQVELIQADPSLTLIPWGKAVRQSRDALSGMVLARLRSFIDNEEDGLEITL